MGKTGQKLDTENYVFGFGKHEGKSYSEALKEDPGYSKGAHINVDFFRLSGEDYEELKAHLPEPAWKRSDRMGARYGSSYGGWR